ncbi:uncharacterized protein MELLADRAFT_113913 [Melampsora larici-populina 98AG31]|uniref:CCHC-type domain-containing protein n=1 Tax=Melampsora larici-populina (strain 98AG31 / pathotype 3-4-7) TaxID=747676 RepID=F4SBF7_MELLP|nr:uncharacterized protein MELLADRAFT_113913 [Melampsora larici-populina 98AG31]EGF98022.1 hypothetical protein MELLADRAFT_113913 [Melampsora larici-populina 98AG31]
MTSHSNTVFFLPSMGQKIIPKKNYQKLNLIRRKDLITPDMSARRKSELCYLDMPASAMAEVKAGEYQCYTCSLFGHVYEDCPDKGMKKREGFGDWRLVDNGIVYSVLALWPHLAVKTGVGVAREGAIEIDTVSSGKRDCVDLRIEHSGKRVASGALLVQGSDAKSKVPASCYDDAVFVDNDFAICVYGTERDSSCTIILEEYTQC